MAAERKLYLDPNLHIAFAVTLMVVMGVTSIAPAFPDMAKALGIPYNSVAMLVTIFTLPGIILTPLLGILSDHVGRKKILAPSLLLFGIAGGACFFIRDFQLLLVFRFIQGVGASALGAINVTIIGDLFKGPQRTEAFGYNASVLSIGTAIYPSLGGAMALLGWNYPFLLPFSAIVVAFFVMFRLNNPEPLQQQELKSYFASIWKIIKNPYVIGLFTGSIATFVLIYGAMITYYPLVMEQRFGATTVTIGLVMSAMSVSTAITATQLARLTNKFSEKNLIKYGFLLLAISFVIVAFAEKMWVMVIAALITGAGNGINTPSLLSLLTSSTPTEYRGAVMSLNGMALRVGQTLGPLFMAFFYSLFGLCHAFCAAAVFTLIMIAIIFTLIRKGQGQVYD